MQDNFKYDEHFTKHAWDNMREMLDREMPVKKEKTRVVIWWLPIALVGLGIAYFIFVNKTALPVSDSQQKAVALVQAPASTTNESPTNKSDDRAITETDTQEKQLKKAATSLISQSTKKATNSSISTPYKENKKQNKVILNTEKVNEDSQLPHENHVQNTRTERTFIPAQKEENKEKSNAAKSIAALSSLQSLDLKKLEKPFVQDNIAEDIKLKNSKSIRTALFVSMGMRNYDWQQNLSPTAGFGLILSKPDSRFGLRLAAHYNYRNTKHLSSEKSLNAGTQTTADRLTEEYNEESITNIPDSSAPIIFANQEQAFSNSTNPAKHRLELGTGLNFNLSTRLNLFAGMQASYTFDDFKPILFESEAGDFESSNGSASSSVSYFSSPAFNINFNAGIGYAISPRWGLDLQYAHDIKDNYPNLDNKQRSSFVEIGLRFKLKCSRFHVY